MSNVRAWREKLLATEGNVDVSDTVSRAEIMDIRFASGSLYLNYLWEFVSQGSPLQEKIAKNNTFWTEFYKRFRKYIQEREEQLIGAIGYRRTQYPDSHWTQLERITRLALDASASTTSLTQEVGPAKLPTMQDLNNIGTHIVQVLVECYEKTYGEPMPQEQFLRFTQNPSLRKMLVEWQVNTKDAVHRMLDFIYAGPQPHPSSKFTTDCFAIDRTDATFGFQPEFLSYIAKRLQEHPGEVQEPLRSCPVVYSARFTEMWEWLLGLLSYQLYDTPYPEPVSRSQSAPSGKRNLFVDDLKIGVEPYLQELASAKSVTS